MSRYVLIDYQHLAHKCMAAQPLSATVNIGGEVRVVDTTIPNYTIKDVFRFSGKGRYYTGVFFEGGNEDRKNYFSDQSGAEGVTDGTGYKGNRASRRSPFYEGIELAINLMLNGRVSLYRQQGYEADDLIASMIRKIKSVDPITPIDVITNDSDLLPFVDEQVSLYMRATRQHAEPNCPEHRLYFQVTPETWDEYLSYTSAYGNYIIPYNSMLLFKLIRGDKSDNIAASVTGMGPKSYSALMQRMIDDGVDFANTFRYGSFGDPTVFDEKIKPVVENYFTKEQVDHMRYIFMGVSPKYVNLEIPKQIEPGYLQQAISVVRINILK